LEGVILRQDKIRGYFEQLIKENEIAGAGSYILREVERLTYELYG
jgi:hypothetical protein